MSQEQTLLDAARAGEETAFAALYRDHVEVARREACRRTQRRSYQEDAVAIAFASVFRAIVNGGGPDRNFSAYLKTAVRNAIVDITRRPGENWTQLQDMEMPEASNVDDEPEAVSTMMRSALLALNNRQRRALWATEVEGRSNADAARDLDLTENAFAALKMRARQSLSSAYATQVVGGVEPCDWVSSRADQLAAGGLGYSHRLVVELHIEGCAACASLVPERARSKRGLLALPLLLCAPRLRSMRHSSKAAGFAVATHTKWVAAVLAGAAGLSTVVLLILARDDDSGAAARIEAPSLDVSATDDDAPDPAGDAGSRAELDDQDGRAVETSIVGVVSARDPDESGSADATVSVPNSDDASEPEASSPPHDGSTPTAVQDDDGRASGPDSASVADGGPADVTPVVATTVAPSAVTSTSVPTTTTIPATTIPNTTLAIAVFDPPATTLAPWIQAPTTTLAPWIQAPTTTNPPWWVAAPATTTTVPVIGGISVTPTPP